MDEAIEKDEIRKEAAKGDATIKLQRNMTHLVSA